jgi:hypothetical protein
VASTGHRSWRQVKSGLARKLKGGVARPFADLTARVSELQDATAAIAGSLAVLRREMAELADVVAVQVDVGNQTTELLGRLLATTSARLELLEDSLGQLAASEVTALPETNGKTEAAARVEPSAARRASEGTSSH